ncbi:diguanylate cyclase/phosphodiesterase (GGDEF & EAL domains) with PAS/PAC sensor(s) [Halomonas citrativorans]|uniref:Diguanylate cyclase/phosphodiesterase (GGDEF & EAL domains) with PAS/PAC sensor(S) n=1 Tax=Halomonas citrativorans TaxID=2742612 RepID=A0A1R4I525_9GAMM|nr:diguanylate cyclase/phosphodiesterase (GGDEF & EAL domains) with PAS/PAC sensor(s) [Halomonas citrativorans]
MTIQQDLPISRIMHCTPDIPLCQAAKRMAKRLCSSIVIVENHQALGIWTEHDALMINFSTPSILMRPAAEFMTSPAHTTPHQILLSKALLITELLALYSGPKPKNSSQFY